MVLDRTKLTAWRAFLEAHSSVVKLLEADLDSRAEISLTWYDALVQLQEAGGRLRMSELAHRLLLSRPAATRFVDRLEEVGLIERRAIESDGRGREVVMTDIGLVALRSTTPVHLEGVGRYFGDAFSVEEATQLTELLGRLPSLRIS